MSDFFKVVSVGLDKAILEVDGIVKKLKPPKRQTLLSRLAHTFVEDIIYHNAIKLTIE